MGKIFYDPYLSNNLLSLYSQQLSHNSGLTKRISCVRLSASNRFIERMVAKSASPTERNSGAHIGPRLPTSLGFAGFERPATSFFYKLAGGGHQRVRDSQDPYLITRGNRASYVRPPLKFDGLLEHTAP